MNQRRIEEAALNAWPPLQQILHDGWLLRFADGYTKRANSANPIYPSSLSPAENVAFCEREYTARGLPPIFRLTPFAPEALDAYLAAQGYRVLEPTLVMTRGLEDVPAPAAAEGRLAELPLDDWLAEYHRMRGTANSPAHRGMLRAIPSECCYAVLMTDEGAAACGLGVREGELLGIFDIVTDPLRRGQGYGTQLVQGLLGWAVARGARVAYLQVVEANEPARRLYTRCGFAELYRYWYRVK